MRIFSSARNKFITGTIAAAFVLALLPATHVFAGWGPTRPTFTWNNTATYVTFDSITDNPQVGDEHPFLSGKVITDNGNVVDNIKVHDNDEVVLRVFYHNNAAQNLNLVSTNTRVKIFLPTVSATNTFATSFITSDNANPRAVTDTVDFNGERPFTLEYETGSAQIWNNVLRGTQLSDNIVNNTGALIGYDSINGNVPGCAQFSGYVTVKVRVHMPSPTPVPTPTPTPSPTPTPVPTPTPTPTQTQTQAQSQAVNVAAAPAASGAKALPNTGPGDVAGLFAGTSVLGGAGHYLVTRRRR